MNLAGLLRAVKLFDFIQPESITQDKLAEQAVFRTVPLLEVKRSTGLPLAVAGDGTDLGIAGVFGTNSPILVGSVASNDAKTEKARFMLALPPEYVAGTDLAVNITCQVDGEAEVGQTLALDARLCDGEGGVGDALITGDPEELPDAWDVLSFTIPGATLYAGALLDCLITTVVDDTGGTLNKGVQISNIAVSSWETV